MFHIELWLYSLRSNQERPNCHFGNPGARAHRANVKLFLYEFLGNPGTVLPMEVGIFGVFQWYDNFSESQPAVGQIWFHGITATRDFFMNSSGKAFVCFTPGMRVYAKLSCMRVCATSKRDGYSKVQTVRQERSPCAIMGTQWKDWFAVFP